MCSSARNQPNYIHANHSEMIGESGSQTVKIPAIAGQRMDADNNSVLTWVSRFDKPGGNRRVAPDRGVGGWGVRGHKRQPDPLGPEVRIQI
jgi:hypothetical protein